MYEEVLEEYLKWQPWEYPYTSCDMFKKNIYGIAPAGMPKRSRKAIKKEFIIIDEPPNSDPKNSQMMSLNEYQFGEDVIQFIENEVKSEAGRMDVWKSKMALVKSRDGRVKDMAIYNDADRTNALSMSGGTRGVKLKKNNNSKLGIYSCFCVDEETGLWVDQVDSFHVDQVIQKVTSSHEHGTILACGMYNMSVFGQADSGVNYRKYGTRLFESEVLDGSVGWDGERVMGCFSNGDLIYYDCQLRPHSVYRDLGCIRVVNGTFPHVYYACSPTKLHVIDVRQGRMPALSANTPFETKILNGPHPGNDLLISSSTGCMTMWDLRILPGVAVNMSIELFGNIQCFAWHQWLDCENLVLYSKGHSVDQLAVVGDLNQGHPTVDSAAVWEPIYGLDVDRQGRVFGLVGEYGTQVRHWNVDSLRSVEQIGDNPFEVDCEGVSGNEQEECEDDLLGKRNEMIKCIYSSKYTRSPWPQQPHPTDQADQIDQIEKSSLHLPYFQRYWPTSL